MRNLATLKTTRSNNCHGITAAQLCAASSDTEGSTVSEDSPTLVGPSLTVFMARAFVQASYESIEDITDLPTEVSKMLADAKANLEGTTFATGGGSTKPKGVVTDHTSHVSPTTGGTFVLADVYKRVADRHQPHPQIRRGQHRQQLGVLG